MGDSEVAEGTVASNAAGITPTIVEIEGNVKWFDPRKGFGFVIGPAGQDVFVHFSVIAQSEGFRTLKDGERVLYSANVGAKGWSATSVRALARETKSTIQV